MVRTRDGRAHNGSLQYTLQPIKPIEEAYFEKQIREAEARARFCNEFVEALLGEKYVKI